MKRGDELFFYYTGDKMRVEEYAYNTDGTQRNPSTLTMEEKADMDEGRIVASSKVISGDLLHGKVMWENSDLSSLEGEMISFRFKLQNGSLYSYWFDNN